MYPLGIAVHITVKLYICTCLQKRMYRNNARIGRNMVSTRSLISKRVTKTLHFRKVFENGGFEVPKKWPSVKLRFAFLEF